MTAAEKVSIGLGFLAILVAIAIPLWIEWRKRPSLIIKLGDDADRDDPRWRIVHVRVVNEAIPGRLGRFLLRNDATGCEVRIELKSRSGPEAIDFPGKWSATPEPIQYLVIRGQPFPAWDPQRLPAALVYSVPPGERGQAVAVAIKHGGDAVAYGFGPKLYEDVDPAPLRAPSLALPDPEYDVTVTATAGQLEGEGKFVLCSCGTDRDGLSLRTG